MMLARILTSAVILLISLNSAYSQSGIEFQSVDSFVKSLPNAEIAYGTEGDLMGKRRTDWTGIILFKDAVETQIIVLERLDSGNYTVATKSKTRTATWGTGNFMFEEILIRGQSLFVDFSYHYGAYRCDGHVVSQFKLHRNIWRMIGVKSEESCDCTETKVVSDTNLLTGNANVVTSANGKSRNRSLKIRPRIVLLSDFVDGWEFMSMHERGTVCQPCKFTDTPN